MENNLDVQGIVKQYLENNGYDGLCSDSCGCEIDDLFPCDNESYFSGCQPGYKIKCDPETCEADGDCEFHISTEK